MKRATILCILLGFGLAGCGGGSTPAKPFVDNQTTISVTMYNGHPLYCEVQSGNSLFGWSCDYVRYHHDYGFSKKGK